LKDAAANATAASTPAEPKAAKASRWASAFRVVFEFALLFGIAVAAKQVLAASTTGSYPNPLWLPVIVLSLQHGLAAGLAAAVIAAGLHYWGGLPPALMAEDMYAYIGRIAAEPVGWTCVALLIGSIRSRQITQTRELEFELAERTQHSAAVADLCEDLRERAELLERHIAANAQASNIDVAEAVSALHHASLDNFAERLTRFVLLMTGATEFSAHVLHDHALRLAFRPGDDHRPAGDISADDPIFAAIVTERRLLSAARAGDAGLLGERGLMAGPLLDHHAPERVTGMLVIGGSSLDDYPDDIERRFMITASELSRLTGRMSLLERWQAAPEPLPHTRAGDGNGSGAAATADATPPRATQACRPASSRAAIAR
jgi:polysaccharide biosynthesis protein PelD